MKSSRSRLRLIQGSSNDGLDDRLGDRPGDDVALEERGPDSEAAAIRELGDDCLVPLAAQGDTRAAEMLYRRHATFAFNLAVRIAGSTQDVEDVVHDAFLRAFDSLGTLRNPKVFKSWLGSIVVHAVRSRLRRARLLRVLGIGSRGEAIDIDCIASEEASPRTRAELAQVYALLQTLAPDDRIAWTLRFVEGHDLKATAELCDCSLATIKRRIRRAQRYVETHFVATGEEAAVSKRKPRKERAS